MSVFRSDVSLSRYDIVGLLEETDKELSKGEPIRITLAGGAAMLFWNEKRGGTKDVDVIADPKYVLLMKLLAARPQDRHDAVILARRTGMRNYDGLVHAMKKAFPAEIHGNFNLPFIAEVADRA